mgnify:CR=1 FL=1
MFRRTLIFNRLVALVLIGAGAFAVWMEGDGTFLIFALLIGMPLFFAKENWTTIEVREVEDNEVRATTAKTSSSSERVV